MSDPLCDAVLDRTGSAAELEAIEAAGLFLVPLDRSRTWFRYHGLFRDVLRRELERREADVAAIHGRAADWLEAHGEPEAAIDHAAAAGELAPPRLLAATVAPTFGGLAKAERRLAPSPGRSATRRGGARGVGARARRTDRRGRAPARRRPPGRRARRPRGAVPGRCGAHGGRRRRRRREAARWKCLASRRAVPPRRRASHLGDDRGLADARPPGYDGPAAVFERAVSARALLRGGHWDEARAELAAACAPVGDGLRGSRRWRASSSCART